MVTHHNYPLSKLLYYRIGGNARWVLEAQSVDDIFEAVAFIQRNKIERFMVVGLGSNLLMHDKEYDGAIIHLKGSHPPQIHLTNDGLVAAFAGQELDELIHFSFRNDLQGLESLGGLPSTIGGAIRGNAGAFGVETEDVMVKVSVLEVLRDSYKLQEFSNEDCQFAYRNSLFKQNPKFIILKGFFQLENATKEKLIIAKKTYKDMIMYRKKNHPVEYPSCGSVFKNIREKKLVEKIVATWPDSKEKVEHDWHGKVSMGYVIKRLGFTGLQIGGAKITEKHANYISNVNHAKAADVLAIINQIKEKFEQTFGSPPELEAEIIS